MRQIHIFNQQRYEPTLVIWLAYSEELCEQAVTEFQKAWDSLGDRILSQYPFFMRRIPSCRQNSRQFPRLGNYLSSDFWT
ncbi:MAG TPA: hypothetical protein IGS40_15805 [Trichormus sp. M33_DOE_039]|nr:hypothetical protein [Trichormus sp. M33_DOE_039]